METTQLIKIRGFLSDYLKEKEKGMKTPTHSAGITFPSEIFQRDFNQSKMLTYEYYYCKEVGAYNKMVKNF